MLLLSSGSKKKPSKKPAWKQVASRCLFFGPEYGGDMFRRNVGWLSTDYTALYEYPRK
jgi:hypothetical protein